MRTSHKAQLRLCLFVLPVLCALPLTRGCDAQTTVLISIGGESRLSPEELQRQSSVKVGGIPLQRFELRSAETEPLYLGLVVDESGSVKESKLHRLELKALLRALKNLIRPGRDRVFLTRFNHESSVDLDFTGDMEQIERTILQYQPAGGSAALDAMERACNHIPNTAQRKALIVVSDGRDNSSHRTLSDATSVLLACSVPIFAMRFEEDASSPANLDIKLDRLSKFSGGRAFHPKRQEEVEPAAAALVDLIRRQYLVSFDVRVEGKERLEIRTPRDTLVFAPHDLASK